MAESCILVDGPKWSCSVCNSAGGNWDYKKHARGPRHQRNVAKAPPPASVPALPLPPLPLPSLTDSPLRASLSPASPCLSQPRPPLPPSLPAAKPPQQSQSLPPSTSSAAAHALVSLGVAPATISPLDLAPSIQFPSVRALIMMFALQCAQLPDSHTLFLCFLFVWPVALRR
jgi:hypothetical protein